MAQAGEKYDIAPQQSASICAQARTAETAASNSTMVPERAEDESYTFCCRVRRMPGPNTWAKLLSLLLSLLLPLLLPLLMLLLLLPLPLVSVR